MPEHQSKSAVVLSLDGLRPSVLGPYGNTWFETTHFNQLGAESQLFENCVAGCPNPDNPFRDLLLGSHAVQAKPENPHLIDLVNQGDQETILITSNSAAIGDLTNDRFDQVIEVNLPEPKSLAIDFESTQLAVFFAEVIQVIERIDSPTLLWLDCNSLVTAWDAPYEYRMHLADEDDPEPPKIFVPPDLEFNPATDDPDQLLGFQQAYGAQVGLLDQFLGVLMEQLDSTAWSREALFCLVSHRGYPLGEHGVVGFYRPVLHSELIHTPMFFRWPELRKSGMRSQSLVQPSLVYPALADWFGCLESQPDFDRQMVPTLNEHEAVISVCQSEYANYEAIQTHGWKFIRGSKQQLYVRPDDCWEVNEVSNLCRAIVEELDALLSQGIVRLEAGQPVLAEPLEDHLAFGLE